MPFLELFDETLDINSTEIYELSLQVSSDELSFCVLDTLRNKFVLLRSYEPEDNSRFDPYRLSEIIKRDDFLIRKFKKTNIITSSSKSTLVPAPLFDDSRKDEYLKLNHSSLNGEKVLTSKLPDPDIFIIFSFNEGIINVLNTSFPGSRFMHQLNPLFNYINFTRRSAGSNSVHVHLEGDYMNMVIFDQSALKFCNTFHYKTISDIQYFVLYVLRRMNINPGEAIYFSGRMVNQSEILHGLAQYLSSVRFAIPPDNPTLSYVFNEAELHRFLLLFIAVSCE